MRRTLSFALLALVALGSTTVTASSAGPAAAADPAPNTYPIVLSGDFTGDHVADLFFYSPSTTPDVLYDINPENDPDGRLVDIWTYSVQGSYRPVVGDFTGSGADDIFWYQPGAAADVIWDFRFCNGCDAKPTYKRFPTSVNGTYTPVSHKNTVIWYGRGSVPDSLWEFRDVCSTCAPSHTSVSLSIKGSTYQPVAGNFLGDRGSRMEVFWYNPSGPETMWTFDLGGPRSISSPALNVVGTTYKLAVSDLFADQWDDIVFVGPGTTADSVWAFNDNALAKLTAPEPLSLSYTAVTGVDGADFEDPGGFFVYDPGATTGSYFDVLLADGAPETPYIRYDFDPAPLTELPPAEPVASATAADPVGRRWPMSPRWREL